MKTTFLILFICFFAGLHLFGQQTVSPGEITDAVNFSTGGCAYTWTNDHPEIGLPAFGVGNLPAFSAINNTGSTITANIKAEPAGLVYMGTFANTNVAISDLATYQISGNINIGTGNLINYQIVSKDGKRVYMLSYDSRKIIIINTDDNSFKVIDNGAYQPLYAALSNDDSRLYVSTNNEGTVKVYNTADYSLIKTNNMPVPGNMVVTPDDSKIYVKGNNEIYEINTSTYARLTHPVSPRPSNSAMSVSPDGKEIYMTTFGTEIVVFNTDTKASVTIPVLGSNAIDFALSNDGATLYVSNYIGGNIAVVDTHTKMLVTTIPAPYGPNGMDMSPNGSRLFVTAPGENRVYIYNTADNHFISTFPSNYPIGIGSFVVKGACPSVSTTITVTPPLPPPVINIVGNPASLTTDYGVASAPTQFSVSATGLSAGIRAEAPAGFEISINNITFGSVITLPNNAGNINSQNIYVRLKAATAAGVHTGDVRLTTAGSSPILIPIPNSNINKAPLTITLNAVEKTYGTTFNNLTGATTGFSSFGLVNGETIIKIDINYGTGAAATAIAGIYNGQVGAVNPAGDNFNADNYSIDSKTADIVVNKAPLKVIADNKTKKAGLANPPLTYHFSGFVNGEDEHVLTSLPDIYTMVDDASLPGTYSITVSGGQADNYSLSYISGTLTVNAVVPSGLVIPGVFTPNADGINDLWIIKNIDQMPNCVVNIFTRSGQRVFTSVGYGTPWDGKIKGGNNVPPGVYYYVIDPRNKTGLISGSVTVVR